MKFARFSFVVCAAIFGAASVCAAHHAHTNAPAQNSTHAHTHAPAQNHAQNFAHATHAQAYELAAVIVSATGFEQTADSNIRQVQVIQGEQLHQRAFGTLEQALQRVAGITFVNTGTGRSIDLRGQGGKANVAVKVMLDGKAINVLDNSHGYTPLNSVNVDNIERIEIIPGGGAVLYGSGTRGGVINIITKKRTEDGGSIALRGSTYGYGELGFNANANFAHRFTDWFAMSANFDNFNEHGYQEGDKTQGNFAGVKLFFTPSETASLDIAYDFYKAEQTTSGAVSFADLQKSKRPVGNATETVAIVRHDASGELSVQGGDKFEFGIVGLWQDQSIKYRSGAALDGERSSFGDRHYGGTLKGKYSWGEDSYVVFGYDARWHKAARKSRNIEAFSGYAMSAPIFTMTDGSGEYKMKTNVDMKKTSHSVFALASARVSDEFSVSGGARIERADYDGQRYALHMLTINNATMTAISPMFPSAALQAMLPYTRATVNATTPIENERTINFAVEVTPRWSYSDTGSVYAKYERGFVSPTPAQMTSKDATTKSYYASNLDSETYDTFEIGWRDVAGGEFEFEATAFYTISQDEIAYLGNPHAGSGTSTLLGSGAWWKYYNIDKTRRIGAELAATQHLMRDKLTLRESLTYINARVTAGVNCGQRVPYVPDFKATFGAEFAWTRNFATFVDVTYYSRAKDGGSGNNDETGEIFNQHFIKEYTLVDVGVSFKHRDLQLLAGVRNVFDTQYFLSQGDVTDDHASDYYYLGSGRNFYVEAKYNF